MKKKKKKKNIKKKFYLLANLIGITYLILVKEYILELSEVAIQEELQGRYEHKIKMKKVFRHIKHPNKRRYRLDHDYDYGYSRTYLDSDDEHDSDLDSI